jgi:hypothetical protein
VNLMTEDLQAIHQRVSLLTAWWETKPHRGRRTGAHVSEYLGNLQRHGESPRMCPAIRDGPR